MKPKRKKKAPAHEKATNSPHRFGVLNIPKDVRIKQGAEVSGKAIDDVSDVRLDTKKHNWH